MARAGGLGARSFFFFSTSARGKSGPNGAIEDAPSSRTRPVQLLTMMKGGSSSTLARSSSSMSAAASLYRSPPLDALARRQRCRRGCEAQRRAPAAAPATTLAPTMRPPVNAAARWAADAPAPAGARGRACPPPAADCIEGRQAIGARVGRGGCVWRRAVCARQRRCASYAGWARARTDGWQECVCKRRGGIVPVGQCVEARKARRTRRKI